MSRISIVVPVYNDQEYIYECITSVIRQNDEDYEIIIVDDGSSDNSFSICQDLCQSRQNIKLFKNPQKGVSSARNYGIQKSTGEYILFLDSDDKFTSNSLKIVRNYINKEYDFIMGTYSSCYISSKKKIYRNTIPFEGSISDFIEHIDDYLQLFLLQNPTAKVFKAAIIRKNDIVFPQHLSYGEDVCFVYDYLRHCKNVRIIEDVLYEYTIKEQSLSHGFRAEKLNINLMLNKRVHELKASFGISTNNESLDSDRDALISFWKDIGLLNPKEAMPVLRETNNKSDINKIIQSSNHEDRFVRRILFFLAKKKCNNLMYLLLHFNAKRISR